MNSIPTVPMVSPLLSPRLSAEASNTETLWAGPGERPRFLSEADCHEIAARLARFAVGGGYTAVRIESSWTGNVRWARNQVSTSGEVCNNQIYVTRFLNGARSGFILLNDTSDAALVAASRRAERMARLVPERPHGDLASRYRPEPFTSPQLFSEATYQLDADRRAEAARHLVQSAAEAGMLSAGYIEVSAHSLAAISSQGQSWYFPYTQAQYSVTVRDPKGVGSGWAGVDWYDWSKIDGEKVSAMALDKCLRSRNPVAVEPGRYTVILEPQAVCDIVRILMTSLSRELAEQTTDSPWNKTVGQVMGQAIGISKLGDRVIDERISISADPMDPQLGVPPFDISYGRDDILLHPINHPVTWIDHGVLVNLEYGRDYGLRLLHQSTGLGNSGAFRISGGTTSIEEMIATTTRGLWVTRFDGMMKLGGKSLLLRGSTRDGLWLIEKGKVTKPVKNLTFTESPLFALNNVDQLGVPQRTFYPPALAFFDHPHPAVVPPLKVRDFNFTALDDAI